MQSAFGSYRLMRSNHYAQIFGAVALLCTAQVSASAEPVAAPVDSAEVAPGDIVVTGERTRRTVKDTPSSVAVFNRDDIAAAAGADRIEQMLELVPNVQVGSAGDAPAIRGQDGTGVLRDLPAFLGGARPRTTLQVDGRAVSYNELAFGAAGLWDVARVEVFRSPQTTTQGRNAIAGAIFIETADPAFAPEARLRAIAGDYRTRQLSALLSGPLIGDDVALRVSGDWRRSRSSSRLGGAVAGRSEAQLNRDNYGVVRAKLLARPDAIPGLRLLLTYAHVDSAMPQVEGVRAPFRKRRDPTVSYGYFTTDVDSLTAAVTYAITPSLESRTILSWGDAGIRRFAPAGFGETRIAGTDRSAETVLQWTATDTLGVTAGAHYLATRLDQSIDLTSALLGIGTFDDVQRSVGLFGQVEWRPAPRLTVTAGLRHQSDRQERDGVLRRGATSIDLAYDKTFTALLPKVSLAYDLSPTWRAGAMVQRAYNPGGVALDLRTRAPDRFAAERLWNYELFARGRLLGGKLTAAANIFYNDIEDAQRPQARTFDSPAGPVTFAEIDNAPKARSYGAELELGWRASRTFSLRAAAGLLRTRITETLDDGDQLLG